MNVIPMNERVVIRPLETEEKTAGGIYIPESAKEKTNQGEVVAVWDEKKSPVKVGDTVIYESFAGTELSVKEKKHLILKMEDVLAVMR
ncbi:MAG: co-chaperone GroES [archaeon]